MKITFLVLTLFFGLNKFAQTHEIVTHNGVEHQVNYIKQENNIIYYSNPGSLEEQKISSFAVSSLKDSKTSQQKMITPKVVITSQSDYKKVKVLESEDQAIGLKKAATFTGLLDKTKGISPSLQLAQTTDRIKNRAASEGYSFVVISKNNNGTYEAIAYTY